MNEEKSERGPQAAKQKGTSISCLERALALRCKYGCVWLFAILGICLTKSRSCSLKTRPGQSWKAALFPLPAPPKLFQGPHFQQGKEQTRTSSAKPALKHSLEQRRAGGGQACHRAAPQRPGPPAGTCSHPGMWNVERGLAGEGKYKKAEGYRKHLKGAVHTVAVQTSRCWTVGPGVSAMLRLPSLSQVTHWGIWGFASFGHSTTCW